MTTSYLVNLFLGFGLPGHSEWLILLALGLLIFGRRLPEVGRNIGHHFTGAIHRFFDNYIFLQEQLLPFLNSSTGQSIFQSYLKMNSAFYTLLIMLLRGP